MKIILASLALLGASAAVAQVGGPTQLTGTPPATASAQIYNTSVNSYSEPSASPSFDATGTQRPEWLAKMAKFRAAKAARAQAKAAAG
ncbi:MAG: hypothetical protein ACRYG4_05015 [Janthinobacterium lividum]